PEKEMRRYRQENLQTSRYTTMFMPTGGDAVPVRVVVRRPDQTFTFGETRLHTATTLLDIRVADAPELTEGDGFQIDGFDYVVQGDPSRDAERLIWTAELREK
ncbi:MAG: hypothetical protein AAFY03_08590, partial [Pseudomonadota bacterium]